MKNAFENSCLKGCLVYVVALVIILVVGQRASGAWALNSQPGGDRV